MVKYIVEGRHFLKPQEAITFAQRLAEEYDRSIDIEHEVHEPFVRVERRWMARMHPPGMLKEDRGKIITAA